VRRQLAAVSSLFDYLCDRNAVAANPASGVARPKEGANQGKTPAISDNQARRLLEKAAGHGKEQGGALFRPLRNRTSIVGIEAALSADSLWRIVMSYAKEAGIDVAGFRPHLLRATSATNALEHGADIAAVSEWLGHASITTTRLYDKRVVKAENSPTFRVSY